VAKNSSGSDSGSTCGVVSFGGDEAVLENIWQNDFFSCLNRSYVRNTVIFFIFYFSLYFFFLFSFLLLSLLILFFPALAQQ